MKKLFHVFLLLILLAVIAFVLVWANLEKVVSHFLTKDFTVPVKIEKIEFASNRLIFRNFEIGNPPSAKAPRALFCKTVTFYYFWKELWAKVFTIDAIAVEDIDLQVEFFNPSGDVNNWTQIVNEDDPKHIYREYRIKLLDLKNLVLTLRKYQSSPQTYPAINLTLYNITNETGVPIDEIEKAIFHAVLRSVFKKFSLPNLLDKVNPSKVFPKFIPFLKEKPSPEPQAE